MKRILITGKNSYVGNSFVEWVEKNNIEYSIDTISLRNSDWKELDFSLYNCIIHLAAIVHQNNIADSVYYDINRDLTIEVAEKAKSEGVEQFIFFSTMSVYGKSSGIIDRNTVEKPVNAYGASKLAAEIAIEKLQNENFNIAIIRPPMIYGKNCPGNYAKLSNLFKQISIFPNYQNKRSMIHIDNLIEFVRIVIDNKTEGKYHPQNKEYVCTSLLIREIRLNHKKTTYLIKGCNHIIKNLLNISVISKIFGDLQYDRTISEYPNMPYQIVEFEKSIELTEKSQNET